MTVTMLGVSDSGKTTYIVGAYAELIHGVHGCYLHTPDSDVGMDLVQQLSNLREGNPPPPTPDRPVRYDFVLTTSGTAEQTAIDLTDFRGGAAFAVAGGTLSDTTRLHERLLDSDAIFVVLDSSHFREPVTEARLHAVRQATGADRFEDLIGKALAERERTGRPAPSIAVLLTKADLIDGRPGSTPRDQRQLEAEIRRVMPGVFRPRVPAMVFAVSVGGLAATANGQAPARTVDLRDVADPVIFAVGWFLAACQFAIEPYRDQARKAEREADAVLAELTAKPPIARWFRRSRIIRAQAAADERAAQATALDGRWSDLGTRSQQILSRFYLGTGGGQ
jgi:double-GTPase-like protein